MTGAMKRGRLVNRRAAAALWHHARVALIFLPEALLGIRRAAMKTPVKMPEGSGFRDGMQAHLDAQWNVSELSWGYVDALTGAVCFTAAIHYLLRHFHSNPATVRQAFEFAGARLPVIALLSSGLYALGLLMDAPLWLHPSPWYLGALIAMGEVTGWVFDIAVATIVQERRDSATDALRRGVRLLKSHWRDALATSLVTLQWFLLLAVGSMAMMMLLAVLRMATPGRWLDILLMYGVLPLLGLVISSFLSCVLAVSYVLWIEGTLPGTGGGAEEAGAETETWRTRASPEPRDEGATRF